jgi:hypothetical protein
MPPTKVITPTVITPTVITPTVIGTVVPEKTVDDKVVKLQSPPPSDMPIEVPLKERAAARITNTDNYLKSQAGLQGKNPYAWSRKSGYTELRNKFLRNETTDAELKALLVLPEHPDCSV